MTVRVEAVKKHKHDFLGLWWTFGPYGRQDVHVHDCGIEGCQRVVVGPGRNCDGDASAHHRETLR